MDDVTHPQLYLQTAEQVGAPHWPELHQSGLPGFFLAASGSTGNETDNMKPPYFNGTGMCSRQTLLWLLLPDRPSEAERPSSCRLRPAAQRTPASSRQPPSPWLPPPSGRRSAPGGHSAFITKGRRKRRRQRSEVRHPRRQQAAATDGSIATCTGRLLFCTNTFLAGLQCL